MNGWISYAELRDYDDDDDDDVSFFLPDID